MTEQQQGDQATTDTEGEAVETVRMTVTMIGGGKARHTVPVAAYREVKAIVTGDSVTDAVSFLTEEGEEVTLNADSIASVSAPAPTCVWRMVIRDPEGVPVPRKALDVILDEFDLIVDHTVAPIRAGTLDGYAIFTDAPLLAARPPYRLSKVAREVSTDGHTATVEPAGTGVKV